MRLAFCIEETGISGDVRQRVALADALIHRGHEVTIVTRGLPLTWRRSRAEWACVDAFGAFDFASFDFVLASGAVAPTLKVPRARLVHHSLDGIVDERLRGLKTLAVTPQIVARLRALGIDARYAGPVVDDELYRDRADRGDAVFHVLLAGASQIEAKGIETAYGAVAHAKWHGAPFDLVRVSRWSPSREEPLEHVSEFHVAIGADEFSALVQSCDIALVASRSDDAFPLVAGEAMAAALACVFTRVPALDGWTPARDYALFGAEDDPIELGDALLELFEDDDRRHAVSRAARRVAEDFRGSIVAERVERALQTTASD